ncbi:transglutaminase-like domain-containing protein [Frateuria defendens]|uniref:transglutaminase-like domain-containing protein n=1 Tax=Frateuria defendens TaxID=2219559 RepID=UPI0009E2E372|nr:transglutaminase domain-containing protein [Frateuria defendens]
MTTMHASRGEAVPRRRQGRRAGAAAVALLLALGGPGAVAATADEATATAPIIAQIDAGRFRDAEAAIARALAQPGLPAAEREALAFQRERMRRIRLDFTLDAEAAKARLRRDIPDLSDAEFARWDAAGLIEHLNLDGRTLYFKRAPSNLFRLSAEARARRAVQTPFDDSPLQVLGPHQREARAEARASGRTSVAPRRVHVTQTVTVKADAVPAGETVRAWIPYPRELPGQQEALRLLGSTPAAHTVAPASAPMRTVYLEQPAQAGKPTVFAIDYDVTVYARDYAIDPAKVVRAPITPALAPYVAERPPHVVFTGDLRAFSRQVVGGETNPYRIAQKLFAAVDRIPWAGAREYSTLSHISDYTLHAGHGDCGQQTLLLIALLRLNGIPARWQSGWIFSDTKYEDIHDWGWLYLAPYGWVPMDVTFGQLEPAPGDDPSLRWFYLGGLDAYRVAFNDDYGQPLVPAKQYPRSDTVDSQRGEVEWRGGNLYYDQWSYHFAWQLLPVQAGH